MAREAIAAGGARRLSIGRVPFVGTQRRAGLLALLAVGLLAVLVVAVIGSRPRSSEPTIEKLVYSDPRTGLVLEDPPGSTPKVIVNATVPSAELPPCFASDVLAERSACWSWVAVSPSGRYIALNAITSRVTMTNSVTSVLTLDGREVSHSDDGQVDRVRWSPVEDVRAINGGVELQIVDAGGQITKRIRLPFEIEAVHGWSPDGRHVIVRAMYDFDLWAVDIVSGDSVRLTDTPTVHELESDWSPDGSRIAYTADCGDAWTSDGPCPGSIWTVRPDGSERRRLTPEDGYFVGGPTWAPDGKHLAYTQGTLAQNPNLGKGTAYVSDADGSNPRQITTFAKGTAVVLAWSPDGSTIVVAHALPNGAGDFETVDTWIMGADGSDPRILVPGTMYVDQVWASSDVQPAASTSSATP